MKSRASIALYIGLVFASGLALGVFGDRTYNAKVSAEKSKNRGKRPPTPEEWRKLYLSGMQKQLLLTDDQVQNLSAIMDETRRLTDDLNKHHQPEYESIQKSQREKIRALFTPEQLRKYDNLRRPPDKSKTKPDGSR